MPNIPRELRVRRGDDISKALRALVRYAEAAEVYTSSNDKDLKVTRKSQGTLVSAKFEKNSFLHPFKIRGDINGFSVSEGSVNGATPFIKGSDDKSVSISGYDENGELVQVPKIKVKKESDALKTYIAIKVTMFAGGEAGITESPDSLSVVHVEDLSNRFAQGGSPVQEGNDSNDRVAYYPLAKLYWSKDGAFLKFRQIVHHNLNHRYVAGGTNAEGNAAERHYFWAA